MAAVRKTSELADQPQTARCPACGQCSPLATKAWKFVNARGETEWLKCGSCQSYFMDREYNLESEVEHTQKMTWGDAEQGAELNQFKQRMYQSILRKLTSLVPPDGRRLLDVGCAYGGFLDAARSAGFDVCGFDIVPEAVAYVKKHGMRAQCCGSMAEFSLEHEPFDVISVLDANIYWPDQPGELREIYERLKPGGLLVMRNVDKSWMARMGAMLQHVSAVRGERLLRRAVNDHRFSMPTRSFLRLLKDTGFRVISASPRGALHSDESSAAVKLSFALGTALWHSLGVFLAPGAVIIAEKPVGR